MVAPAGAGALANLAKGLAFYCVCEASSGTTDPIRQIDGGGPPVGHLGDHREGGLVPEQAVCPGWSLLNQTEE